MGSIAADNKLFGIADVYNWRTTLLFPAGGFLKIAITWLMLSNEALDTQANEKEAAARLKDTDEESEISRI